MPSSMKPVSIVAPFKGVITDLPSGFDPQAFDLADNFLFRKGRIQARPQVQAFSNAPPDGRTVLGLYSFLDVLDNWHTLVLTDTTAYFITAPVVNNLVYNALTLPASVSSLGGSPNPFAVLEMDQQVFFCNGATPLMFVDGSAKVQLAGDFPGSCLYLAENSSHLIAVNCVIPAPGLANSTPKPFLVLISDVNDPLVWTPSDSNSAVEINLIEKGGVPTGATTQGAYTYIWRQYGANVLTATGNAAQPFLNEPLSWSNPGWGCYYPYTLQTWNASSIMVSHSGEVLLYQGAGGPNPNGMSPLAEGKVHKTIASDLVANGGGLVVGFITDQLGPGYDFNAYVLWLGNLNKAWVLNLVDMTWSTITITGLSATAFGNIKVH